MEGQHSSSGYSLLEDMVVLKGPNFGGPMDQIFGGPMDQNFGGHMDWCFGGPMDQSFVDRCYILGSCTCAWTGFIFHNGLTGGGQQGGLYSSLFYGFALGKLVQSLSLILQQFSWSIFLPWELHKCFWLTSFLHAVHFLIFLFCL